MEAYFSSTYTEARARFRDAARRAGATLHALGLDCNGPAGEDLTIDAAILRGAGSSGNRSLLLHTSGLHGVEGFAGSAIQLSLLEQPSSAFDSIDVCFLHTMNPFGMAWHRRVNERNVDLNRNFPFSKSDDLAVNPGYGGFDRFLNPLSVPGRFDTFYPSLLAAILRCGATRLRQTIASGQNEYPEGLFYRGTVLEQGPALTLAWLRSEFADVRAGALIDVHTGLGKSGLATLLGSGATELGGVPPRGDRVVFYRTYGSWLGSIDAALPGTRWATLAQEFGTIGPVAVLRALRSENRWHRFGDSRDLQHWSKRSLLSAFNPVDNDWRESVLRQGRDLVFRSSVYLRALKP